MTVARIALALLLAVAGWRVWQRQTALALAARPGSAALERALARDPDNPDLYMRLGRRARDAAAGRDYEEARRLMERAVALRPKSARFLAELGALYELMGRMPEAEESLRRALALNPRDAPYIWRLANLELRLGKREEAVALLGEAMARDRTLADAGVSLLLKAGVDSTTVERHWPAGPGMAGRLLQHLLRYRARAAIEPEPEVLARQWTRALAEEPRPTPSLATSYLAYLGDLGRLEEMRAGWIAWQQSQGIIDAAFSAGANALWNGDFELPLAGGPLAWRRRESPGWSVAPRTGAGVASSTALALEFRAARGGIAPLQQHFVLAGGADHRLSAQVASERLAGPQLVLEVEDLGRGEVLARLPLGGGSQAWREVTIGLDPVPATTLCRLTLRSEQRSRGTSTLDGLLLLDKLTLASLPGS